MSDDPKPHWSRRTFLAAGALAAGAATVGCINRGPFARRLYDEVRIPDLSTWSAVRSQFDLDPRFAHFASFLIVSHPKPVQEAIEAYRDALDRRPARTLRKGLREPDETEVLPKRVRADMAPYLGADPEEIALTPNTTTGLALIYHGLPLKAGDEVLTTTHDHYSHHESIRLAVERCGATWRKVPLYEYGVDTTAEAMVERLSAAIRPETRVVGVTWVHSSSGMRLPIRDISAAVHTANEGRDDEDRIRLVVDGVHGFGSTDETIAEMGCDFLSAGTHKWIFAPRGTGIIWGRKSEWPRMRPTIPSFEGREPRMAWREERAPGPTSAADVTPGGYLPFEHHWATGVAFRMHETMGKAHVAARIRELNDMCKAGLTEIDGVRLLTPRDASLSAGLIAFEIDGWETPKVVGALRERNIIASASPYKTSYPRLAPSLVNTEDEVERAVREIASLARS